MNTQAIAQHLSSQLPTYKGFPVNITLVNLDNLSIDQMLQEVLDLDVFISAGGSALFHSILMHDGAVVIGNQLWDNENVLDFEFDVLVNIPYVRFQMYPLKASEVMFAEGSAILDPEQMLAELKQALYYAYNYKNEYYCDLPER